MNELEIKEKQAAEMAGKRFLPVEVATAIVPEETEREEKRGVKELKQRRAIFASFWFSVSVSRDGADYIFG